MSTSTLLSPPVPPLKHGDRLTRDEFERRYEAMPDLRKAELIEGVVHMPSPVRYDQHGGQHADLIGWLSFYRAYTPGVGIGDNSTVRLDLENEPQPDALAIVEPEYGGKTTIEDGYITGGPEWVGEVSASSAGIDLGTKFRVYRRNQVGEYLVWQVFDNEIAWFALRESQFERLEADTEGILRSTIFPGLWLDAAALLRGDLKRVFEVVQRGIGTPEHADFVTRLASARSDRRA